MPARYSLSHALSGRYHIAEAKTLAGVARPLSPLDRTCNPHRTETCCREAKKYSRVTFALSPISFWIFITDLRELDLAGLRCLLGGPKGCMTLTNQYIGTQWAFGVHTRSGMWRAGSGTVFMF